MVLPKPPNHGTGGGPLAWTGAAAGQLRWLSGAVLIAGVALLLLVGRRRPNRGHVR